MSIVDPPGFDCIGEDVLHRHSRRRRSEPPGLRSSDQRPTPFVPTTLGLIVAILPATSHPQSKETMAIVRAPEFSLPGAELSGNNSHLPVDLIAQTSQARPLPRGIQSAPGVLFTEDHSPSDFNFSFLTPTADVTENELPSAPGRIDLTPLLAKIGHETEEQRAGPSLEVEERYHWKGLLLQSLAFIAVENTFRLMTDETFRTLTADKPYWHDYIASLEQWNMRRWNDGDDFLVDDIGHPMQGAVSSFIEIQNDPRARNLQISSSSAYWKSRFMGFLWATVFSTQQKIGPLGEAALGSDGGETYVPGCKYPCPGYKPGVSKYTNNTGWTDFIATPVIGTAWVLLEDSIDRYISDPVQDGHPDSIYPKILRGGLNPCRTMANAMRLKAPWYRDFQHPFEAAGPSIHFAR